MTIARSCERVFAALTQKDELEQWLALTVNGDAQAGARSRYDWTHEHATGEYVDVEPPFRLLDRWDEPDQHGTTLVEFTLESTSTGCRLTLTHSGFGAGPSWDALFDGVNVGWPVALSDLKYGCESGEARAEGFRIG